MCVCAGTTGAAVIPAAKAIRHHVRPTIARPHRASTPPAIAAPSLPCAPVLAAVSLDGPVGGLEPFGLSVAEPGGRSGFVPVRGFGPPTSARTTGGFPPPVDGGPPGVPGGPPGVPGGPPGVPGDNNPPITTIPPGIPTSSNAPEPTTWILMIGGFGMLGGAMRYSRITKTA